jgi:MPBQ/MSBQ methyltransferase
MASVDSSLVKVLNSIYDQGFSAPYHLEFFNGSGFSNFGYWTPEARNGEDAAQMLVDKLVALVPKSQHRILDVACGQGGTTERLAHHFPNAEITGINISENQLNAAKKNVPKCTFIEMNAEHLAFDDASFDTILCIEAAFHFDSRETFLKEAFRVLKPGGSLIMTDILFRIPPPASIIPSVNHIKSLNIYQNLYENTGFHNIRAMNHINETWRSCRTKLLKWSFKRFMRSQSTNKMQTWRDFFSIVKRAVLYDLAFKQYLLVYAQKPV